LRAVSTSPALRWWAPVGGDGADVDLEPHVRVGDPQRVEHAHHADDAVLHRALDHVDVRQQRAACCAIAEPLPMAWKPMSS
jgi:hypothetical protein